jgi:hypothetical protein
VRLLLIVLGATAWVVALAAPWLWPGPPEKEHAFYALGHWFDRVYEVQLPLAALGAIAIGVAVLWKRALRQRP